MNGAELDAAMIEDRFAVAQVVLYVFAVLQIVVGLATATGGVPLGIAAEATTMQRVSAITNALINVVCFVAGYFLLARCLNRCTRLVWRIALTVFLVNAGASALAMAAHHNVPFQVLACSLSIAGAISVWRGRSVIRKYTSVS